MDEFLGDIYTELFRKWILTSRSSNYTIEEKDNIINIKTKYCIGSITFNKYRIIELSVTNLVTEEIEFYLHFQLKTLKHAIGLYREMLVCIESLVHKPITKVLLSCTSGLTTNYFAMKINEASKLLNFHCECEALSYNNIFKVGENYDMIMLAPQISYLLPKIQSVFKDKTVISIPASIFASYDVGKMIDIIREERYKKKEIDKPTLTLKKDYKHDGNILCISLIRNSNRVHIAYRLYDKNNNIILDKEIIKYEFRIEDIYDVIDIVLLEYSDIQVIGLCTPGIIHKDEVCEMDIENISIKVNIQEKLKERYHKRICVSNDVNTVAVGFYASQNEYNNIALLFQPLLHLSGVGIIIDGKLITGSHDIAGEVQYLPYDNEEVRKKHSDEKGAIETAANTIITISAIVDPQAVVVCCQIITDIDDLKKEIEKYLPKEYIPKIIKVDYLQDYMLLGQLILCVQDN